MPRKRFLSSNFSEVDTWVRLAVFVQFVNITNITNKTSNINLRVLIPILFICKTAILKVASSCGIVG